MKMKWAGLTFVVLAGLAGFPIRALASHNLLDNATFDSGIEGWTLFTPGAAEMHWDPELGNPAPGSLRLSGPEGTAGTIIGEALSETCFELPPGTRVRVDALTRAEHVESQGACRVYLARYTEPGCGGSKGFLGGLVTPDPDGVWLSKFSAHEVPPGGSSFRVSLLAAAVIGEDEVACNFDSVVLYEEGTLDPLEVPALSILSMLVLGASLGLSAFWLLRHRP